MIQRILVALDADLDTPVATRYASEIAVRSDGEVSGLAMVDVKQISSDIGGGAAGTMHYVEKARTRLLKLAHKRALELSDEFHHSLSEADVAHEQLIKEGVPYKQIIQEMKYHDLLVIGRSSHFLYTNPERDTHTLAQVVKKGVTPTLVIPDEYVSVSSVLIAYDDSDSSAKTLQRFAQLKPFGNDLNIHIVNVQPTPAEGKKHEAEFYLTKAADLLAAHGFESVITKSLVGTDPATKLMEQAELVNAGLLVAGAHSVSALRRIAFGSTTANLLSKTQIPLFLFH